MKSEWDYGSKYLSPRINKCIVSGNFSCCWKKRIIGEENVRKIGEDNRWENR
jgi:hypothetical protein